MGTRMLTLAEAAEIGDRLDGTSDNVFDVGQTVLGWRPGPDVFDDLARAGYAKCVECNVWQRFTSSYLEDLAEVICDACEEG